MRLDASAGAGKEHLVPGAPAREPRFSYSCFGLHIRSEIELTELAGQMPQAAAFADASGPPVDIVIGSVPAELPNSRLLGLSLSVNEQAVLINVPQAGRILVRDGREIVIDPIPGYSPRTLQLVLLGSAFGAISHQRGLLPLHANAVVIGDKAVAFAGPSGIGKSTMAAYFQGRGFRVLCDDVCVVSFSREGKALAWPGAPRVKLWREAAEKLGHDSSKLELAYEGSEKYQLPIHGGSDPGPLPLSRIYLLSDLAEGGDPTITRISGSAAMRGLMDNIYRRQFLQGMGLTSANFAQSARLAQQVSIYRAPRRRGYDVLDSEGARLEAHVRQSDTHDIDAERALID